MGRDSQSCLQTSGSASAKSQYKKNQIEGKVQEFEKKGKDAKRVFECFNCGQEGHMIRDCENPCKKCGTKHKGKKCEKKKEEEKSGEARDIFAFARRGKREIQQNAVHEKMIQIDHHKYSNLKQTWEKSCSKPSPTVSVNVVVDHEGYKSLGLKVRPGGKKARISIIN